MLVKFDERYMSGFRSETYQLTPEQGFVKAIAQTVDAIRENIEDDIGGDEQRIDTYRYRIQQQGYQIPDAAGLGKRL
jgi:hypothetical protein